MQQGALVMRLLATPSFVPQPKPAQCGRIRDKRALRQLFVIVHEPSPDIPLDRPESYQRDHHQHDVAIPPEKPTIGTDPVTYLAAVRSIINLRATGRTFHNATNSGRSFHRRIESQIGLKANTFCEAPTFVRDA